MPVDLLSCGKDVIGFRRRSGLSIAAVDYPVHGRGDAAHESTRIDRRTSPACFAVGPEIYRLLHDGYSFLRACWSLRSVAGCFLVVIPQEINCQEGSGNRKKRRRDRQDGFADRQSRSETGVPGREAVGEGRSFHKPPAGEHDACIRSREQPIITADFAKAQARCGKRWKLRQGSRARQAVPPAGPVEIQRTELAQVSDELAHSAKWLKLFDEENARLTESGSLAKG